MFSMRSLVGGLVLLTSAAAAQAAYVFTADTFHTWYGPGEPAYPDRSIIDAAASTPSGQFTHDFASSSTLSVEIVAPAGKQFFVQAPANAELRISLRGGTAGWSPYFSVGEFYDASVQNLTFHDITGLLPLSTIEASYGSGSYSPGTAGTLDARIRTTLPAGQRLTFSSISFDIIAPPELTQSLSFDGDPQLGMMAEVSKYYMPDPGQWFGLESVPEPVSGGLLTTAACTLLLRRKRHIQ